MASLCRTRPEVASLEAHAGRDNLLFLLSSLFGCRFDPLEEQLRDIRVELDREQIKEKVDWGEGNERKKVASF